jgi:hypothetical protein
MCSFRRNIGWIGFSEDDSKGLAEGANIRRQSRISNALKTTPSTLSLLIVEFVANLVVDSAREARWLFAGFRQEVRVLLLRPGAVFRLHRIGR